MQFEKMQFAKMDEKVQSDEFVKLNQGLPAGLPKESLTANTNRKQSTFAHLQSSLSALKPDMNLRLIKFSRIF